MLDDQVDVTTELDVLLADVIVELWDVVGLVELMLDSEVEVTAELNVLLLVVDKLDTLLAGVIIELCDVVVV